VPTLPSRSASDIRAPRLLAAAVVVALLALVGIVANPVQATPDNPAADEAAFVSSLNATRARQGLAPLKVDAELRDLARDWAQHMADAGQISHANPISAGVTSDWLKLGENVGTGGNVTVVMNAFIASPGHYANIMDPAFTRVGVGVVWVGNALYTVHRFMKVAGEEAGAPPAPEPPPAPAPPPATEPPAPAPAPEPTEAPAGGGSSGTTAPRSGGVGAPRKGDAPATTTTTTAPPAPTPPPAKATRVASVLAALRGASS
jgi:hypothetical protein